jgi:hypothetical protein
LKRVVFEGFALVADRFFHLCHTYVSDDALVNSMSGKVLMALSNFVRIPFITAIISAYLPIESSSSCPDNQRALNHGHHRALPGAGGRICERTAEVSRRRLYEVELEYGKVISSIVRSRRECGSERHRAVSFRQQVQREGIRL